MDSDDRIVQIELDEGLGARGKPEIEQERAIALQAFIEENSFSIRDGKLGPYHLTLGLDEDRLLMKVRALASEEYVLIGLPLSPFRKIFRDYFLICDSYFEAIRDKPLSYIEAIDMGRRSLHNEAAEKLCAALDDRVVINKTTARRLFTLLCVLHSRH